jgi:1-acyl-sn-glycerol-3-phosphate acyltransferase
MPVSKHELDSLTHKLVYEICKGLNVAPNHPAYRWLEKLFWLPARHFTSLVSEVDWNTREYGISEAARRFQPRFYPNVDVRCQAAIPNEGPLILAANHPGTFDFVIIAAQVNRPDVTAIARDMPFLRNLPGLNAHLIYSTREAHARMGVLRASLRHLQKGGALLLFPTGRLDPDPAVMPGAREALENWSESIEFLMEKVPDVRYQPILVSGLMSPNVLKSPLVDLKRRGYEGLIRAEILQVILMMYFPRLFHLRPSVAIGPSGTVNDLAEESSSGGLRQALLQRACLLLQELTKSNPPTQSTA